MGTNTLYVGIDLALGQTGLCVRRGDAVLLFSLKESKLNKKLSLTRRAISISDQVTDLIVACYESGTCDLVVIALENYIMGGVGRICDLAFLSGVLRKTLVYTLMHRVKYGVELYVVPPKSLKSYATGNGNSGKPAMIEEANFRLKKLKQTVKSSDEADAFLLSEIAKNVDTVEVKGLLREF